MNIIDSLIQKSGLAAISYKFKQDIPQRPNPLKLSKWVSREILEINSEIDDIEKKVGVKCTCKKGCAECCNQMIAVAIPECLAIQPFIDNLIDEEREELKKKVLKQCEILVENNLTSEKINGCKDEKIYQKMYFELNMPCIFLTNDNACAIHAVRPTLCWSYRNYGDSSKCKKSFSVDSAVKYDDWEMRFLERLLTARPTKERLYILPFAIKKIMNW